MKTATKAAAAGSAHSYTHPYQSSHSRGPSLSRSSHAHRASKGGSTTPLASPRGPYSVGQNNPPKLSPGRGDVEIRATSPNYFGLTVEASGPLGSSGPGRNNWSPPSSSVKSFGAAIPTHIPLDANPEFEAFKRQADLNKGKSFSFSSSAHHVSPSSRNGPSRPRPSRWHTHASDAGSDVRSAHRSGPAMDVDQESLVDSAYVSAESKRNSESSLYPAQWSGQSVRFESPHPLEPSAHRASLTKAEDRDPRLSMMEHTVQPPSPQPGSVSRASTLPAHLDTDAPSMISGEQLRRIIQNSPHDPLLLLDIRSAQNHATSRIHGALNLCIPTTLLKRATFHLQKLQQTFQGAQDSERFAKWREASVIVVYDSHASDHRDAVTAQNMIKKFTNEGFTGRTCILRGGFAKFKECHPDLVDSGSPLRSTEEANRDASHSASHGASHGPVAPVIGGVNLPAAASGANPFFSNIRQNMDLADGVGQFEVRQPEGLAPRLLPAWLRKAASREDKGKIVSDRFLKIEQDERSRMQTAYAAFDPHTAQRKQAVQLCGVEKGAKNRYKDILPFEHARVKLQNKHDGACDYVNASHLATSRSNKRYIAAQGPLPATFEDFWSIVWEQDVRVLVMLTAESEGGQLKCHSYWKDREYGSIILKQLSEKKASLDIDKHRADPAASAATGGPAGESGRKRANTATELQTPTPAAQSTQGRSEAPFVMIRKFALSHASHPFAPMREITQLHFSSWPDFGTPANPAHLLALVELANVMQRASVPMETASVVGKRRVSDVSPILWHDDPEPNTQRRPMLVHCSAGCGRTGTFCAVDSVIDMLKRQRQAKAALRTAVDSEGDVSMGDGERSVSPRTNKRVGPAIVASEEGSRQSPRSSTDSVDTEWLQDDELDLVQKTVEEFRQQRLSMVQTLRQYVLCYETILEWTHRMNDAGPGTVNGRARGGSLSNGQR